MKNDLQTASSPPPLEEQPELEENSLPVSETSSPESELTVSNPQPKFPQLLLITLGILSLIITGILGWRWWQWKMTHITTDNAQIQGHISPISAKVSGIVEKVLVEDGDYVKAGQPLIILETKDLQLVVQQAEANLKIAQAKLQIATKTVGITQDTNTTQVQQAQDTLSAKQAFLRATQTQVQQAQASVNVALSKVHQSEVSVQVAKAKALKAQIDLNKIQEDWKRYDYLSAQGAISKQQRDSVMAQFQNAQAELLSTREQVRQSQAEVDTSHAFLQQAQAQLKTAQAQFEQALADVKVYSGKVTESQVDRQKVDIQQTQAKSEEAQVAQAQATLDIAKQQLNYTVIKAPISGYIGLGMGQMTVQVGQLIQPQQPLLSIVPLETEQLYVEANFKETALKRLHIGENAEITADSYPGEVFPAVVSGISPATGAQFALIPPDNATGNYNKVVQWVPVRLTLKPTADPQHKLRAGLSVKVTVSSSAN